MQYTLSYWEKETFFKNIDVAIIGAGIVGLSTAIFLKKKQPHLRVAVLERGALPIGASTRNAGFACFGSLTELIADMENQSEDAVLALLEKRYRGLQKLRTLLGDDVLDYQALGGYEMFRETDKKSYKKCLEYLPFFNEKIQNLTGLKSTYTKADAQLGSFGFEGVSHLILNHGEGQVHTGQMMESFIKTAQNLDIQLFTGIEIEEIESHSSGAEIQTRFGFAIQANKVVVAVNGFAQRLMPNLDVQPARNLVLVTKPIPDLKIKGCFHYDEGYVYFRNINGRILLGGGRNLDFETEKTTDFGSNERIKTALLDLLQTVILPKQNIEVDQWWSGIMGLGAQKAPIVQWVQPNIAVALRLGGMGVAIGTLVGEEAADLVLFEDKGVEKG